VEPTWRPTTEPERDVLFVEAQGGPAGAPAAFEELERRIGGPRGRRFFGAFHGGVYRACVVRRAGEDAAALGLGTTTLPGGAYLRTVHRGAVRDIHRVIVTAPASARDDGRPDLEDYRRAGEIVLLVPVRGAP
jgi:hypothetical protein